jgi:streptogramin lyase
MHSLRSLLRRHAALRTLKSPIQNPKSKIRSRRLLLETLENRSLLASDLSISDATATEGTSAMKFIDTFITPASGEMWAARGIDFGPDGNLYISSDYNPSNPTQTAGVNRYHAATGQFMDRFATLPASIGAKDVEFGPDGNLYVPTQQSHSIYRFNGATGEFMDVFVPAGSGGLNTARSMLFGPDANGDNYPEAYVTSAGTDSVLRYDGITGQFLDAFVPSGSGGLNDPTALVFGPTGDMFVASGAHTDFFNGILRYDGITGAFKGVFVAPGSAA